jgi:hypothetical protein
MLLPNLLLVLRAALGKFSVHSINTFKERGPTQERNGHTPEGGMGKGDNP